MFKYVKICIFNCKNKLKKCVFDLLFRFKIIRFQFRFSSVFPEQ
jgi:hypothetical protein